MDQDSSTAAGDPPQPGFYRYGSVAAGCIAVLLVGEIVVYATVPRMTTALEHFSLFQNNALAGLLSLDLLGMISYVLFIPLILALYVILRRANPPLMAFGTVLFFVGIANFFATNTAFPMWSLSQQYAAAMTGADRAMYLAAGQSMLTIFNENAFLVSYVLVSAAWVMISIVMVRSGVFGRLTAWAGILAGGCGIAAVFLEHILPAAWINIAIALYFAAIVFLMIWVIRMGNCLSSLSRLPTKLLP